MACDTINPRWSSTGNISANAIYNEDGSFIVKGESSQSRDFMLEITEAAPEKQETIVATVYEQTQRIILLVRDRLERERPYESDFKVEE